MKYSILIILLISNIAHAGLSCSRPAQAMPVQYIYVTPTLADSNSNQPLHTGKYSYVDFSNGTLRSAQRPSQPHDNNFVDIESAQLSSTADPRANNPIKSTLAITYSIKKRTESEIVTIQQPETVTFNLLAPNNTTFEKDVPTLACKLSILVSRQIVVNQFHKN